MSEYQYHEWQTIDRVLTRQEQMDVDSLSNHIEVTASRAVVTYHWSDFRHNPKQVLLDHFDAYFYCANWYPPLATRTFFSKKLFGITLEFW